MGSDVPALAVLIDLPLGILMWCAILRFFLSMVVKEDSRVGVMRLLNAVVLPPVRAVQYVTPSWVFERTAPLYLAFLIFIIRFYAAPLALGYEVYGFGAMPLEGLILSVRTEIGL